MGMVVSFSDVITYALYMAPMSKIPEPVHVIGAKADDLRRLYDSALEETINAIRAKLSNGKKPEGSSWPTVSIRNNGMPSISEAPLFERNGPLEFSSVLEPSWNDPAARAKGKFPEGEFPYLEALVRFVLNDPEVSRTYMEKPHEDLLKVLVTMGVESAANTYFLRFGDVASDQKSRTSVLRPLLIGLTSEWLRTPVVIPIAFVRFDFNRVRLSEDAILIRMSDGLQRARWEGKARAANGHDAVLAAATHALILTNWGIPNDSKLSLGETLSNPAPHIAEVIDSFFAAMRLALDLDTGYAQEIRLAKGWRSYDRLGDPQVYAVGARRYPPHFDNYGWMREDIPHVGKEDMKAVAQTWKGLLAIKDSRFALALRRFNAASTRDDPADVILDATIALEILLGDGDGQSISWKLRMRAAAILGLDAGRSKMDELRTAINNTYGVRSAIVHGGKPKSKDLDEHAAAKKAVNVLRTVINAIIAHPIYLDPLKIDADLLLTSRAAGSAEPADGSEEASLKGSQV